MTVLVTGGTGFIGSHLVERLLKDGRSVRVLALETPLESIEKENENMLKKMGAEIVYGDLMDYNSLIPAVKGVDVVYHLGGISRPMKILDETYYDTNVAGTQNLLEVSKANKLKRFIHVSSVSVLGVSPDGHPLEENEYQLETMHYGLSKRVGERIALDYNREYQVPVTVIRPCLVYGPRCMVRLVMFKAIKYRNFPLFNNGNALMEFCYVDNVVSALLLAEKSPKAVGAVFNITDGQSYKISNIITTIASSLNVKPSFIKMPYFLGKIAGYFSESISYIIGIYPPFSSTAANWMSTNKNVYSCEKAKNLLGYKPKVSLKQGVKKSVAWYKNRGLL